MTKERIKSKRDWDGSTGSKCKVCKCIFRIENPEILGSVFLSLIRRLEICPLCLEEALGEIISEHNPCLTLK